MPPVVVRIVVLALFLGACTSYARGERYFCFAPFETHRCKQPPYAAPDETRTKDDAAP